MYDTAQSAACGRDTLVPVKPNYTDLFRYPRGYVRAECTDVAKTWAAARPAPEANYPNYPQPESSGRGLKLHLVTRARHDPTAN